MARRDSRFELAIVALLVAPIVGTFIVLHQFDDLPRRLSLVLPVVVLLPVVLGATLWAQRRYADTGRLLVDDSGIRLESQVPAWLGAAYQRPWRLRWEEIAQAAPIDSMGLLQLRRKGAMALPLSLRVADWVPAETTEATAASRRKPKMRESALWEELAQRGLFEPARRDARAEAINFDLAKHPATRAALALMVVLAAYWALDGLAADEKWAEWNARYLAPHAVFGLLAMLLSLAALLAAKKPQPVPIPAAIFVALLLGACTALATWTGGIRVNQAFSGPLEARIYVRNDECDALVPLEEGLPPIEYTHQAREYWCSVPKAQKQTVLVRRGLGGLYQVDLREQTRAIREYRARKG